MEGTARKKDFGQDFDPIAFDSDFPVRGPCFSTPPFNPHIHNCFEIGFCLDGGGLFLVEDKMFQCSAGTAIFINNREFHSLRNATPENSRWKFINLDPVRLLAGYVVSGAGRLDTSRFSGPAFSNVIHEKDHPEITSLVKNLISELEGRQEGFKDIVKGLVWVLIMKLTRLVPPDALPESPDNEAIARIAPALKYISSRFSEPVYIEKMAIACGCSLSNFRRIFTRVMKCSPQEYLIKFRLNIACLNLLNTNMRIIEVSDSAGFPTLSNFNRSFRKHFAVSPRVYRASGGRADG
jgi:AraC-like DNA-binding protein